MFLSEKGEYRNDYSIFLQDSTRTPRFPGPGAYHTRLKTRRLAARDPMVAQSRLHVPKTPARPGDAPDFSYLKLSPAGKVARPDAAAPASQIRELSEGLVRVLDDKHRAVGPWNPHLEVADLQVALRHMMLTRVFDDRMQRIQRSGRSSNT